MYHFDHTQLTYSARIYFVAPELREKKFGSNPHAARALTPEEDQKINDACDLTIPSHRRFLRFKASGKGFAWRGGEAPNVLAASIALSCDSKNRRRLGFDPNHFKNLAQTTSSAKSAASMVCYRHCLILFSLQLE